MDYFSAFWTGGLICALVQILTGQDQADARTESWYFWYAAVLLFQCPVGIYQPFAPNSQVPAPLSPCLASAMSSGKAQKKPVDTSGLIWGFLWEAFTACAVGVSAALDLLIPCQPDLQAQNERVNFMKGQIL